MSGRSVKKSGLFLIELTFAVLCFAVCAAVCTSLFASAKKNTDYGRNLTNASIKVQSAAELFKGKSGDLNALAEVLGGEAAGGELRVSYNGDWLVTQSADDTEFILSVRAVSGDGIVSAFAQITDAGGVCLFSVTVKTAETAAAG